MLPCVGCVGVVLGGRCWHSPFPLAMACCDSRPGFCCLKSPSVVSLPSFRHPPLGHKLPQGKSATLDAGQQRLQTIFAEGTGCIALVKKKPSVQRNCDCESVYTQTYMYIKS